MAELLSIGEFSHVTHVSVKALRHYHDLGLLEPADVDSLTGYRFYVTAQIPTALVIRRLRELDMPLDHVRAALHATDISARDEVIVSHLERMEDQLEHTQAAVAALRALLDGTQSTVPVEYRSIEATPSISIRARVLWEDIETWLTDAYAELSVALGVTQNRRGGPDGALYSAEFFELHVGEVVAFVPVDSPASASGRVEPLQLPGGRFAVTEHRGSFAELDRTYGALGTVVMERALSTDGPIREMYLVTSADTDDPAELRTEVCWPITSLPERTPQ